MIDRRAVGVAIVSTLLLVLTTVRTGQSLYSDPAAQFKTV